MQLTPRYGTNPVLTLDGSPADVLAPVVRQRRRLAAALTRFDDAQWSHPSRCAGWSSRDVIVHLDSTNSFWAFSIASGVSGKPTTFLKTFDPVASPAQLVAATDLPAAEVLSRFEASNEALIDALERLADDEWDALAEAPPGHISISALAHHALWDSWVHERDILLPLGLPVAIEADEVAACLRYGVALGPALARTRGEARTGMLALRTTAPHVAVVVEIDDTIAVRATTETAAHTTAAADVTLEGDAVELLEALSIRRPLDQPVASEHAWMLAGLAETFDASGY